MIKRLFAAGLAFLFAHAACAQTALQSIEPERPQAPILWRPYLPVYVPPVRLANSGRLKDFYRAGAIYLTAKDAIALALENNIDIEIARYNPILATWNLERAQAGGALPGVPSGASAANSVASGQGVLGSQAAAGVGVSGSNGTNVAAGNTTITQLGPVTQTLDPILQGSMVFSHKSLPQPDAVQSLTSDLVQNQRIYSASYQQGLLTGGSVTASYNNHYLSENAPTDLLNPSEAPTLSVQIQHNLLKGFGIAVNERTINVARVNLRTSDLNFKNQVMGVVANVLNAYYALVADYEDVKAQQSALATARQFYSESQRRVELGALAPLDTTAAESQLATTEQNVVNSNVNMAQDQITLKNLISRTGTAEPLLREAQIVPLDKIEIPEREEMPPVRTLMQTALDTRPDLAAQKANETTAAINSIGTKNALLPTEVVFAAESNAGLGGTPHRIFSPGSGIETANAYFVGGLANALGQIFRRNFPSEIGGQFFGATLRNRQAQADYAIDQLSLRQTQIETIKQRNQTQVDVMNAAVAIRQARARYEAAVRNRILAEQLLQAEQRKYALGASTPYNVVQQQRDLLVAQSTEIADKVSYSNAHVLLEQTAGTILDSYHVSVQEARSGVVSVSK